MRSMDHSSGHGIRDITSKTSGKAGYTGSLQEPVCDHCDELEGKCTDFFNRQKLLFYATEECLCGS